MKTAQMLFPVLALTLPLAGANAQQWNTNNLPSGLIAWWQAEGDMLDSAGPHHGGGSAAPTYGPGRFGQAFQFNGTDQSVSIPDIHADLDSWAQFTLEAWVYLDNRIDGTGGGQAILSKVGDGRQPGPDLGYQFGFGQGATKLFCQFNTTGQPWPGYQTIAVLSEPAPTNTWLHVAATYDHSAVKIYLNGVPLVTNVIGPATIVDCAASLRLNSDDNWNVFFAGRIDDARIYNRALSETEVADLYQGPPAPPEIFFAEDVSPYPVGGLNDVPRPLYPRSQSAAAQFLARLHGTTTESFEGLPTGSLPTTLAFGTNTATLAASSSNVCAVQTVLGPAATDGGWFPTTGTNFLGLVIGLTNQTDRYFRITFSSPQAALGFYGTDAELNQIRLRLVRADGATNDLLVPVTVPQGSGGVFYFGIIDRAHPFTSVLFESISLQYEGIGFDDLTIGSPNQVLPAAAQLQMTTPRWLQIIGTAGATYRIEQVAALGATNNWTGLTNLVLPTSPHLWLDPDATSSTNRIYRAVGIP
jgi:hypothetical protein